MWTNSKKGCATRREFLARTGGGFGVVAVAGLVKAATHLNPLAPKTAHEPAKAKAIIYLFMHGGVSHVDTFDPKPKLAAMNGKPLPFAKPQFEFAPTGNLLASPWKFQKHGQSGVEVSELFPQLAKC